MDGKQRKTPLYQAVVEELTEQIRTGAFSFDEPLCTEARLMEKHGISRITARRALDELEEKGIVGPFQGSKPREILITQEQWETMRSGGTTQMEFDDLPMEDTEIPEDI